MVRAVTQVCHAVCLAVVLAATGPASATERVTPSRQHVGAATMSKPQAFDIPVQPLASALEMYGAISGFQVVYDAPLAKSRQSSELKGTFTPEMALRQMLTGTKLSPHYMAADGFVLVADPVLSADTNTASQRDVVQYYGRVQNGLREAFCADARLLTGGHRIAIGLWIGPTGAVMRSAVLDTTGQPDIDAALDNAMQGMTINAAPPAGFAQPVVMTIAPDVLRDCAPKQRRRAAR
jgi:hypothetical protein